jgi:hypothetical protein
MMDALRRQAAEKALAGVSVESYGSAAADALEEGRDSRELRRLAGYSGGDPEEVERTFARVCAEFGIPSYSKREGALLVSADIAEEILRESCDPLDGARAICRIASAVHEENVTELYDFIVIEDEWCSRPEDEETLAGYLREACERLIGQVRGLRGEK